ncbi:MAG TPA: AraC family transcriptional regulator [Egibacteraceae bacterium]|jgi:AraC-like DNA-binding protein|nr:AraC family transcriptional regulator [Egibacteraceae bacterium]
MKTDRGDSSAILHQSELGRWERAWQRPSPPLRGLVDGYHGYRQRLAVPATHRGVPSAVLPLVVSFGPVQTITPSHRRDAAVAVSSFLSGLHDEHVLIEAQEHHGIQIDLGPVAGFRLLGPLRDFTGLTVPLAAVFGADAERLVDDLACAPDWPSRFRRLDRELTRRLASGMRPDPAVEHAWRRIVALRGRVSVTSLAHEVGWSSRRLRARFGEQLGLSPKRLALLARFGHAAQLLSRPDPPGLAQIASSAGYYDQAHLTNAVRAFSGLTPRQLAAAHLPDAGGVFDLHQA